MELNMTKCIKCNQYCYDFYMVHDHIWPIAKGFLHLVCLQELIGRKLTIDDFPERKINSAIRFGYALKQKESSGTEACSWS